MLERRSLWWAPIGAVLCAVALLVTVAVPELTVVARGLLAGMFLVAGVAKARDRGSFRLTLASIGLSDATAQMVAWILPLAEVTVACALLVPALWRWGALGALVLLVVLTGGAGAALARGLSPECGCLGAGSARLGPRTMVRNGVLMGLAGGIAAVGHAGMVGIRHTPGSNALATLAIAAGTAGLLLLGRRGDASSETGVANPAEGVATRRSKLATAPTGEAAVTRRGWLGAAGGAGLVGAVGAWFGLLDLSTADAVAIRPPISDTIECPNGCFCCRLTFGPSGPICQTYCCNGCTGFSGGGVIQTPTGIAHASFFGNKVHVKGRKTFVSTGALAWFDPGWNGTGLTLALHSVTSYGKVPGTNMKELLGIASANGQGKHRFVLQVSDSGKPGSGADTVSLSVQGVAGSGAGGTGDHYLAKGHLAQGDTTFSLKVIVTAK
jgi:Methylamine utilisation protein MauE